MLFYCEEYDIELPIILIRPHSSVLNIKLISSTSPLLQFLFDSFQLLLSGFNRLEVLEYALTCLKVVGLHLLHLGRHPLDHLRLPLSQLLHLQSVVLLQLLLQLSHPQLVFLLFLHANVGYLEITNSVNFRLEFLLASLINFILIFQKTRL